MDSNTGCVSRFWLDMDSKDGSVLVVTDNQRRHGRQATQVDMNAGNEREAPERFSDVRTKLRKSPSRVSIAQQPVGGRVSWVSARLGVRREGG